MSVRSSILISHPWVSRGGSEATAMWTLDALQHDFEITFVTAYVDSWDELNAAYGTSIEADKISVIRCPKLPLVNSPTRLVHLQHRYFEKFCQKLAPQFDLCISSYNPLDFGDSTPSIQLVGDFSFSEKMRLKLYSETQTEFQHRENLTRRVYLKLGDALGVRQRPLNDRRRDVIVANSVWTVGELADEFSISNVPILYPPVLLPELQPEVEKRPLSFVCLGRVSPEKEIEKVIEILRQVRAKHNHPVTLTLIGRLDDSTYSRKIEALVSENISWIKPAGFLSAKAKQELLAEHEFAVHGCRIEAFGIAVAEMAALGCVPIVPETGGAGEIAEYEALLYGSIEEAVTKIVNLIENPEEATELRNRLKISVHRFGPRVFASRLREIVDTVISTPKRISRIRSSNDTEAIPAAV